MVVSLKFLARTLAYDSVMADDGDEVDGASHHVKKAMAFKEESTMMPMPL